MGKLFRCAITKICGKKVNDAIVAQYLLRGIRDKFTFTFIDCYLQKHSAMSQELSGRMTNMCVVPMIGFTVNDSEQLTKHQLRTSTNESGMTSDAGTKTINFSTAQTSRLTVNTDTNKGGAVLNLSDESGMTSGIKNSKSTQLASQPHKKPPRLQLVVMKV